MKNGKDDVLKRYNNLWKHVVDFDNVFLGYKKARKSKGHRIEIIIFERDLEKNLLNIQKSLTEKTFHTATYKVKKIFEPKERDIFILPFNPDRVIQHCLMNVVEPLFDKRLYEHSYACRPGKGIHKGYEYTIRAVYHNTYCLKCDVSKFYPSISHDIMYEIIESIFKDKDILWLFEDIIYSIDGEKNIPIGNYVSQWLGNLYLDEMDKLIKHKLGYKDYVRYCDDFILFDNDKSRLNEAALFINEYLTNERNLRMSKCDLFPTSHGVDFLGYRFFKDKILVRKSTAKNMKKRIKQLFYQFNHGGDLEHIRGSLMSTLGWLKWANTYNFKLANDVYKLEWLVRNEIAKRNDLFGEIRYSYTEKRC